MLSVLTAEEFVFLNILELTPRSSTDGYGYRWLSTEVVISRLEEMCYAWCGV